MNKIYAFSNGQLGDETYHGIAVSADGYVLAQCISSTVDWIKNDLGALPDSKKSHDRYIAHYPHGFEVEWVDEPSEHEGMLVAQGLNAKHAAEAKIEELEITINELTADVPDVEIGIVLGETDD